MSEAQAQTATPARRPILEMVQNIRTRVIAPPGQPGTALGQQGPLITIVQRFRAPPTTTGSTQLTGSQDFLIGLGVGALAVVVIGALTFEVWAPRVAARIGKGIITGAAGALPGAGAKGLLGFGLISLPAVAGRGGRTQILAGDGAIRKLVEARPRPLKGLVGR